MVRGAFVLEGGVGFCNAVRRTLVADVEGWAPREVTVHVNTTCQTDEFLAHRIGLVPLRPLVEGHGAPMTLDCVGPCVAHARDLRSPAFEAVHGGIELMRLDAGQRLRLTVEVDQRPGRVHARYAPCAAVGLARVDADRCRLTFETNDDRPPRALLLEALDHLDARAARALHALAHQPPEPPQSYC